MSTPHTVFQPPADLCPRATRYQRSKVGDLCLMKNTWWWWWWWWVPETLMSLFILWWICPLLSSVLRVQVNRDVACCCHGYGSPMQSSPSASGPEVIKILQMAVLAFVNSLLLQTGNGDHAPGQDTKPRSSHGGHFRASIEELLLNTCVPRTIKYGGLLSVALVSAL